MNPADALDIGQAAIWTVILASAPAVAGAMAIGIIIALLQALTFVPKIIAILLIMSFTAPFVGSVIFTFAEQTYARIPNGF